MFNQGVLSRIESFSPCAWRGRGALAPALMALLLLAACGTNVAVDQPVDGPRSGATDRNAVVRVGLATLPTQLDPHNSTVEAVDFRILNLVYDRLLTIESDGSIGPMLATAWEYGADGRSLTLTLRKGVSFRDGTPLDAAAVVANLERARTAGSAISSRLTNVAGVAEIAPNQVRIDLKAHTTEIPAALAQNAGLIMNPKLFESGNPAAVVDGSGPYLVEELQPGDPDRADPCTGHRDLLGS